MKTDYLTDRDKTISSFDKEYNDSIEGILKDIDKIIQNFQNVSFSAPNLFFKEKKNGLFLIFRSIDYLISAINLLRQRATFECFTILRLALETASTAFHISKDNKALEDFNKRKYESVRSIGYAKKHISRFGEIWGALSNVAVHTNSIHGIYYTKIDNNLIVEIGEISIGEKEKNEDSDNFCLLFTKLTCNIIYRLYELIFFEDRIENGIKFIYNKESKLMLLGKDTDEIIDELIQELFEKNNENKK